MELYAIFKGNYPLEKTAKIFKHENNLRFHVKQNDRFYEYSINSWNKKTINLRCVKFKSNCKAKITLILGEHLKTEEKASNSKKKKFEWSSSIIFRIILIFEIISLKNIWFSFRKKTIFLTYLTKLNKCCD